MDVVRAPAQVWNGFMAADPGVPADDVRGPGPAMAENADGAAYADAVSEDAALGRDELPEEGEDGSLWHRRLMPSGTTLSPTD